MTTYDYRTLTTSINALATPPSLILDKILTAKNQNYSSTLEIDIEKSADYKKLAPFTGSSQEGKVISKVGFSTKTVKFPRIRVKKQLSATEILAQRDIGESVYVGGDALKSPTDGKIAREQNHLKAIITKRIEWMAANALMGGIEYADNEFSFSIDYDFSSTHKPVLSENNVWGGTSADILGNLRSWKKLIAQDSGLSANIAIAGPEAVEKLLADENIRAMLNNTGLSVGQLQLDNTAYIGRLCGIDVYECAEQYLDGSTSKPLIPDNAFILAASGAKFVQEYGLIEDLEADARVGMEFFSKLWYEKDPSAAWLLAESCPLPVVYQPDAVVAAKV